MRTVLFCSFIFVSFSLSAEKYIITDFGPFACPQIEDVENLSAQVDEVETEAETVQFLIGISTKHGCSFLDVGTQIEKIKDVESVISSIFGDDLSLIHGRILGKMDPICRLTDDGEHETIDFTGEVIVALSDDTAIVVKE